MKGIDTRLTTNDMCKYTETVKHNSTIILASQSIISNIKMFISHIQLIIQLYHTMHTPDTKDSLQDIHGDAISTTAKVINDTIQCITRLPITLTCVYHNDYSTVTVVITIGDTKKEIIVTDDGVDNHVIGNDTYMYIDAYIVNNGINTLVMLPEVNRGSMSIDGVIKDIEYFIYDTGREDTVAHNLKTIAKWLQLAKYSL